MHKYLFGIFFISLIYFGCLPLSAPAQQIAKASAIPTSTIALKQQAVRKYFAQPLAFEINQGQTNKQVRFLSRNQEFNFYATSSEAVLQLRGHSSGVNSWHSFIAGEQTEERSLPPPASPIRMKFLQANPAPEIRGIDPLPGSVNYYSGKAQPQWRTSVTRYAKVEYREIYQGINLLWYGNQQQLEYDFVLQPRANPRQIKLAFTGAKKIRLEANGALVLTTSNGELRHNKPVAYQVINGEHRKVEVQYVLTQGKQVSFELGTYDPAHQLIIDPVLQFSSFFGGSGTGFANDPGTDFVQDATIDAEGNIYLTGSTASLNFPLAQPVQASIASVDGCCDDAYITRLSPNGVVFSTYLGGTSIESGNAITLDKDGNVIISGHTSSQDFPTTPGAFVAHAKTVPQAFATKLDREGRLVFSTLLGGLGRSYAYAVTTDAKGNVFVAGTTRAFDFPVVNAYQSEKAWGGNYDAFITKLDPLGTGASYSTYLGGEGNDGINAIKVDQTGNIYVTGATTSFDFPVRNAIQDHYVFSFDSNKGGRLSDVFVTKLNADGQSLQFSTYLGHVDIDYAMDLELDAAGNIYLAGVSGYGLAGETSFPAETINPVRQSLMRKTQDGNIFVLKLDPSGTQPLFVSYFGYDDNVVSASLALDKDGLIYVAGGTYRFPWKPFTVTADAYQIQAPPGSGGIAFLTIFDPALKGTAAMRYSTLLTGSGDDAAVAVLLDKQANIYLVGDSTYNPARGGSNDFPILNPPYKSSFGPATDVFIARFSALTATTTSSDTVAPAITITAPTTQSEIVTTNPKISISGTAADNVGVKAITWELDNNFSRNLSGTNNWTIPDIYLQRGKNILTVTAADAAGNLGRATLTITYQPEYLIETFAGYFYYLTPDGFNGDGGLARAAKFKEPYSLAFDKNGNLYVADRLGTRIRKITTDGFINHVTGLMTGSGFTGDGGPASEASLGGSGTIAVDKDGNLFIADPWNHRVRKITPNGIIFTVAGSGPIWPEDPDGQHSGDGGPATHARMMSPSAVAVDEVGNLYIADLKAQRIRKVNPAGMITTIAGTGETGDTGDGEAAINARLELVNALTVDKLGNLYFGQMASGGGRVIRKIAIDGKVSRIAGNGEPGFTLDGGPALATGMSVNSIAFDSKGNLIFVDMLNFRLRRLSSNGMIDTLAGREEFLWYFNGDGGASTAAHLRQPYAVAIDANDNIYVAEIYGNAIRRLSLINKPDAVAPVVTLTNPAAHAITTQIPMLTLRGTATDNDGVFQVKWSNDRGGSGLALGSNSWQVDNVTLKPGLNTITITATDAAGNPGSKQIVVEYQPDVTPPTINITSPTTASTYTSDSIFVKLRGSANDNAGIAEIKWQTDRGESGYVTGTDTGWIIERLIVREGITNLTLTATDYAGNSSTATLSITHNPEYLMFTYAGGNAGFNAIGDGGTARQATFLDPQGMTRDPLGNIYISEGQFNFIRKITPSGYINTVRNGNYPGVMASDKQGNFYVLETLRYQLLKISPTGQSTIVAGNGEYGPIGENVPATATTLDNISSMELDEAGNIYLSSSLRHKIHKINAQTGIITSIAGTGTQGYSADGIAATTAQLRNPVGLAFDRLGNLYFADQNKLIRRIGADGILRTLAGAQNLPQGFSGDGGAALQAQFFNPLDIVVAANGTIFLADTGNRCIRRIKPDGIVSTIAGINPYLAEEYIYYARGEYSPALWASLVLPIALELDANGTIYVLDRELNRIRAIVPFVANNHAVTSVSGASYAQAPVASEAIVSAFGTNLATTALPAPQLPLPTVLGGTTVKVKDSLSVERFAALFYVSATQVNYQIPRGTAPGLAKITITSGDGKISTGSVQVNALAPGLFSAASDGKGLAAAAIQRVKPDGSQVYEQIARFDPAENKFVAIPIDLSNPNEQPYLLLFGTGVRGRSSLSNVNVTIAGVRCEVLYAGPQGGFVGLDQLNVRLPHSLAGRQEVDVTLTVDGLVTNTVRVHLK